MTRLQDGHTVVDTSKEPDGRVRLTVYVEGSMVAAPTFAASDFPTIATDLGIEIRDQALDSIAKGLGWKPDQRPQWPVQVLEQLQRDGLTIAKIEDSGVKQ